MTIMPGAIWCTCRAITLVSTDQGSHQPAPWSWLIWPWPYLRLPLSHFLPCGLLPLTQNGWSWGYCRDRMESLMCFWTPWKRQSLRCHDTLQSAIHLGHFNQIWFKVPPALWQRRALSHDFHILLCKNFALIHQKTWLFQKWLLTSVGYWRHCQ